MGSLVRDSAGNLYGTTAFDGAFGFGTVFEVTPAGVETVLYSFSGQADGKYPFGGVLRDAAGNLYGTTSSGGTHGHGVVFMLTPSGQETALHSFAGAPNDGDTPITGLTRDQAGNVYGTTGNGGKYNLGTVFELPAGGGRKLLHSFAPSGGDGQIPNFGALVLDAAGNLYGATERGGNSDEGAVYKIDPTGVESVLFSFDGTDGKTPVGGVTLDASGNLYGTTAYDGGHVCAPGVGCGVVFSLTPTGQETVLRSFAGPPDGEVPNSNLLRNNAGALFGTTDFGGSGCAPGGCGVVFRLSAAGEETILHSFTGPPGDGQDPAAALTPDGAASFYGTTQAGGSFLGSNGQGCGTVYKITP